MSHTSPASFLVWAILTGLLGMFLLFHLWSFDRFKCLKWNSGPYSGAFKRVMTYSYLISIPLIMSYSIGFAVIKYSEGFILLKSTAVPAPYVLWTEKSRNAIFPLYLLFSTAWSLEMVTHLEELCFWLFLVNAGSAQQDWFRSLYFKTWAFGSVLAITYMPLVTIFTRFDPLKCEAYTFLAGSLGSFSLTLWFTPILWTFPSFLRNLRREGVDTATIVRLTKFHELNTLRVIFRFIFCVPLIVLGVDGVRPHNHINESMLWTDLLAILAAFGCVLSSGITLVIFFPRSIEGEIAARDAARERKALSSRMKAMSIPDTNYTHSVNGTYLLTSSPVKQGFPEPGFEGESSPLSPPKAFFEQTEAGPHSPLSRPPPSSATPIRPKRRRHQDVEMGGLNGALTERNLSQHNLRASRFNPMIHNFTSPIDLAYYQHDEPEQKMTSNGF